jgi:hypothetical protein
MTRENALLTYCSRLALTTLTDFATYSTLELIEKGLGVRFFKALWEIAESRRLVQALIH